MNQAFLETLQSEYGTNRFKKFCLEFFNSLDLGEKNLQVDKQFLPHIASFTFLGTYKDPTGKNLHVLEAKVKSESKLERARTLQRNLIARYIKDHWLDGALVAFYSDKLPSWRLSFVKVEYKFDDKGKTKEELTPAKRYSFLVGKDEPSHTAQSQLLSIYEQTTHDPTLEQVEGSFGVEKVTKEFFTKYRELFEDLVKELKKNHTFLHEAEKYNLNTENFAKKLLGQIVFLYFLQKKGWLGVPKGKSWGDGDKFFLKHLFDQCSQKKENFYNSYLEPLFYDTLNNPRSDEVDRNFSERFNSKIPFLNGGLFEPQYDWEKSLIYLDDEIFKEILGVFDLYNFTVKEDEPLEKEVAVDPEMLGKVFENLIEENLRKGKGTYYTPREIVHYMCQESLINYLSSETNISSEVIRDFVIKGHIDGEELPKEIVKNKAKIIQALKSIKIVDPACGSGAFLVGMLHEIVKANLELSPSLTEYLIRKESIQNSIYGVDIDPGAVEIAKLRLWLSLVVDYELEEIEPLPNLDYKIMVGNSLIEMLDTNVVAKSPGISERNQMIDELKELKTKYATTFDTEEKKRMREQINKLVESIVNYGVKGERESLWQKILAHRGQTKLLEDAPRQRHFGESEESLNQKLEELDRLKDVSDTDHFEWHLNFNEVFEKGGFNIVIANPPYVEFKKLPLDDKKNISRYYISAKGKYDLYVVFLELALKMLAQNGFMTFINPTMFMKRDYGEALRKFIVESSQIREILDFTDIQVFESVTNYTGVFIFTRRHVSDKYIFNYRRFHRVDRKIDSDEFSETLYKNEKSDFCVLIKVNSEILSNEPWIFMSKKAQAIVSKMQKGSLALGKLIEDFFEGIASGKDEVFYINKSTIDQYKIEDKLVYPILRGENIKRYKLNWSGTYVIYPYDDDQKVYTENFLKNNFPNGYKYLKEKQALLKGRDYFDTSNKNWYELWNQRDIRKLKRYRIVTPEISDRNNFTFCENFFGNTKTYNLLLKSRDKDEYFYLLGLLNSLAIEFYYKQISVPKAGGFIEYKKQFLKKIPIKKTDTKIKLEIINLVKKILKITENDNYSKNLNSQNDIKKFERQIDQLVYKLYGLTPEEIAVVEGINES